MARSKKGANGLIEKMRRSGNVKTENRAENRAGNRSGNRTVKSTAASTRSAAASTRSAVASARSKKLTTRVLAVVCAGALVFGMVNLDSLGSGDLSSVSADSSTIHEVGASIDTRTSDYFDSDKVFELTDTVTADTEISLILSLEEGETLLDAYNESDTELSFSEYAETPAAFKDAHTVSRATNKLIKKLNRSGVEYRLGNTYDTLLNGFEIIIKAGDFDAVAAAVPEATLIVSEEYEKCDVVVENDVRVDETGIFDSSDSRYQGDGVVVAVLDTGLDYTHTAFEKEPESIAFSKSHVENVVSGAGLAASDFTPGLTVDDVYVSDKVPYQYDYADKDSDVFPINSEHGTHVSGIIAGSDSEITGVAPQAQIMMMKVFSDSADSAKTSWILAALEDCVKLGVDVINMSLGTSCGFSREIDDEKVSSMYDAVEAAGISLVCAASNDYNSTMGSEKNGSLGLTSNPDSGTVGAPSTYDAALSVASVSGVKDNYLVFGDEVIYYNEATDSTATTKNFTDDILNRMGVTDGGVYEVPYEVIPGIGRASDYPKSDYTGEIVLVKRGTTTFEEKIRNAMQRNALGIIIYNNVSGSISMSIGSNEGAAACSISQDDGEVLVAAGGGTLKISRSQEAGPFMSDFSSWGPTSDLEIKPEITAHGGEIYSCVPGQGYDRLSGTSMASPNMAGVTALIRQYVKDPENAGKFGLSEDDPDYNLKVTQTVNRLVMSTADIIYNKNGLPYSVRKQGAGLVNLYSAQEADAYITTLNADGTENDKAKLELGDDVDRNAGEGDYRGTGVYDMTFVVNNISSSSVSYKIGAIVQTEGVSATYTGHGDTTVTQDGATLDGAKTSVLSVSGGTRDGDVVTISAGGSATVTVEVVLSDADKDYLEENFEYGMYVEGFVTLEQLSGSSSDASDFVDLNVPYLAFYGDWTEAPIFDEEYYDTNADELNSGLDDDDKLMADAYATRVVGGYDEDYLMYMGVYVFEQDPSAVQVSANKDYIAMSADISGSDYTISDLSYVYAGLLRNVAEMDIEIVDDATGKTVYFDTVYNQRKSYGASTIYASAIDMNSFNAYECGLKNNTRYTVTLTGYLDYGGRANQNNAKNTFTFPLYIDYEAPVVTGVEFRTEYDAQTKKTSLYADLSVYDNHYTEALQLGVITESTDPSYTFSMATFGKYLTPVYSSYNSTTKVSVELTDYMDDIKSSWGLTYYSDGSYSIDKNTNSFLVVCYDYALNYSEYEITLPDEIISMYFVEDKIVYDDASGEASVSLYLNETLDLSTSIEVFPSSAWVQTFDFVSSNEGVVRIVGQTALALDYGTSDITVTAKTTGGGKKAIVLHVTVEGDVGYTLPVVNSFELTGYYVNYCFSYYYSDEKTVGTQGYTYKFGSEKSLTMNPSEEVDLEYSLQTYFPDETNVEYTVSNSSIAKVETTADGKGRITALAEGTTTITATVYYTDKDGKTTSQRSDRVSIEVNDPFTTNSIYLMSYKGLGGEVQIPTDRGITTIYQYAFSNYDYIPKDLEGGDVIDEEDPYSTKIWYLGENKDVTKVIIPEGVKEIDSYAFADMTGLEEIVLPSTLTKIGYGAFLGCTKLSKITWADNGGGTAENNLQFINDYAFYGCTSLTGFDMSSIVAVGKYAFAGCGFTKVTLPATCQSVGEGAFAYNLYMTSVTINASSIKLGSYAFYYCTSLMSMSVNASVIPSYAFYGCSNLYDITLGGKVSVIYENAFYGTAIEGFKISVLNQTFYTGYSGETTPYILSKDQTVLYAVAPAISDTCITLEDSVKTISSGAFAGTGVTSVQGDGVTYVGDYAFYGCLNLSSVDFNELSYVGDYAFYYTSIASVPKLDKASSWDDPTIVGTFAFGYTKIAEIKSCEIPSYTEIGDYAFAATPITQIKLGDDIKIGDYAFYICDDLQSVEIGENAEIGSYAFASDLLPDYYTWYSRYGYELDYYYYSLYILLDCGDTSTRLYDNVEYLAVTTDGEIVEIGKDFYNYYTGTTYYSSYVAFRYSYNLKNGTYGVLTEVNIGDGAVIGSHAFEDNTKLASLVVGSGTTIGDYAFYNCVSLTELDLSGVTYIGDYAFSLDSETVDVVAAGYKNGGAEPSPYGDYVSLGLLFAYDCIVSNGNLQSLGYGYTYQKGSICGELDLSSCTHIGEGAFAYNPGICCVELSSDLHEIGAYAFYMCEGLGACEELDLSEVFEIGAYAFACTALESVSLADDVDIGDGAFYMCTSLTMAENLNSAKYIGNYAFEYTALNDIIDISNAVYIGDFAFAYLVGEGSGSDGVVYVKLLGDGAEGDGKAEEIGENPFAGTNVDFSIDVVTALSDGTQITEKSGSYAVNESVFVSNGVLYEAVPNGFVLVTYPMAKDDKSYTVEEGTVRVGANAFEGNVYLTYVTLPISLTSIGDKAFYGCEGLSVVVFTSYYAPLLEEVYDVDYAIYSHLPISGYYAGFEGLGIIDYFIWSAGCTNNYFYGANFVDYIGRIENKLVMVSPANGQNYDSFTYAQYFDTFIEGSNAATADTLAVIAMIASIPDRISLSDEELIVAAREAYDALTLEQQALVTNRSTLESAEQTLRFLQNQEGGTAGAGADAGNLEKGSDGFFKNNWIGLTIALVILIAFVAYVAVTTVLRKRKESAALEASAGDAESGMPADDGEDGSASETVSNVVADDSENNRTGEG